RLPRINNLVMIGVPNRGAPKAFNVLNDNWGDNSAYKYVFASVIDLAYKKIKAGATVFGPTAGDAFAWADIVDTGGTLDYLGFIRRYVPTIFDLMTIDPFLDLGDGGLHDVNSDP